MATTPAYSETYSTSGSKPLTKATAPQTAIGYVQATGNNGGYWWLYDNETTPELQWPQSVYVYDQMRRQDAQVTSMLRAVMLPVLRTQWRVDPAGARDEVVRLIADDLGLPIVGQNPPPAPRSRDRFSWLDHLREALLMLVYGYAYFEQVYRVDPDGSRAHLRKLSPRPQSTIDRVDVAEDGGLVQIWQRWATGDNAPRPIPVNRLVCYVHEKEGGNWLGRSLLRPAYKNWVIKDRLLRVQAQTIERNGMGVPLYIGQEGASGDDLAAGKAMASAWRSGEAAGSSIPFGAQLLLKGVDGTLPDADPAIRYHDEQIARAVLAHFLNLGTQTGSWALGSTFADFFTLSLQTLAQHLADTATCYIVEDLVDINWGPEEPAPRIVFDEIGARPDAAAIATLLQSGAIVADDTLEATIRQQHGLPPKDESAQPAKQAAPADQGYSDTPLYDDGSTPVQASAGEAELTDEEWAEVEELLDALDELHGERVEASAADQLRQRKGTTVGGEFARTLDGRISDALKKWLRGEGSDRPFTKPDAGKPFTAVQLRTVIERTPGLHKPPPRTSAVAMERQLLDHAREVHIGAGGAPVTPPSGHQRFSIAHNGKRIDVGISGNEKTGTVYVHRESDSGRRGARVTPNFATMAELGDWAEQNGHTDLAAYARERAGFDLEHSARDRQAQIDAARPIAEVAAHLHEAIGNDASPRVLEHLTGSLGKAHGVDTAHLAQHAGDRAAMAAAVDRMTTDAGLTRVGVVGGSASFDPTAHEPLGRLEIGHGEPVTVMRPGYAATLRDGERVTVSRPVVAPAAPASSKAIPAPTAGEISKPGKAAPDLTGANGLSADPAIREVQVENRIRAAYAAVLARSPDRAQSNWVGLADLRDELGEGTSRHEIDAALKRLAISRGPGDANVVPESNQKTLTQRDRDSAVRIGDQDKHAISFDDPSPQPLPAAAKKATPKAKAAPDFADLAARKREADAEDAADREFGGYVPPRHPRLNTPYAAGYELDRSHSPEQADEALEGLSAEDLRQVASDKGLSVDGSDVEGLRRQVVAGLAATRADWSPAEPADPGLTDRLIAKLSETTHWTFGSGVFNGAGISLRERQAVARRIGIDPAGMSKAEVTGAIEDRFERGDVPASVIKVARKAAAAPAAKATLSDIRQAGSREEAEALLSSSKHSKAELQDMAREAGAKFTSKTTVATLRSAILDEAGHGGHVGEGAALANSVPFDSEQVANLKGRLAGIAAEAAPIREETLRRRQQQRVPSHNENIDYYRRLDRLTKLGEEGAVAANELLDALIARDGAPWGGDANVDAGRWLDVQPHGTFVRRGNLDEGVWQKSRDAYVIDDMGTLTRNASLRSGEPSPAAKTWATRMSKMIQAYELGHDTKLARGAALSPETVYSLRPGAVITDRGFVSTAETGTTMLNAEHYARDRVEGSPGTIRTMFEIRVPAGTPAANVGYGEVVFDRNSRFRIVSSRRDPDGTVRVVMELLGAHDG